MFFLKGNDSTDAFVLHKNGIYKIGRLAGDIIIKHSSVSRKHAEIEVKNGEAFLNDCNSKYLTKYKGKYLLVSDKVKLEHGSEISFGEVTFTFEIAKNIVVCATGLGDAEELVSIINKIGGTYSKEWTNECTHLTTSVLMITVKVLHAIIDNKKIVTPQYWKDYLRHIRDNKLPPDPSDYYPPLGECIINTKYVQYNAARQSVFKGKTFAFWKKKTQLRIGDLIAKAGGKSILFETINSVENKFLKLMDECIVIEPEDLAIEQKFRNIFRAYKNKGKRLIPVQEIVVAILTCTCEQNCNPNFDRVGKVFSKETEKIDHPKIIVEETQSQSQNFDIQIDKEPLTIIPASFVENTLIDEVYESDRDCNNTTIPCTSKRTQMSIEETQALPDRIKFSPESPIQTILQADDGKLEENNTERNRWKRPNDMSFVSTKKKPKVEVDTFKRPNPYSVTKTEAKSNPFSSFTRVEPLVDLTNDPFESEDIKVEDVDIKLEMDTTHSSDLGKSIEHTKESNLLNNRPTSKRVRLTDCSDTQIKVEQSKRRKIESTVEYIPIDHLSLQHNISTGTWINCSVKEETLKPVNTTLDESDREWYERFNKSVVIVVKDLLRKDQHCQENSVIRSVASNGERNFKKFRKTPVQKSTLIVKCSK